MGKIFCLMGKSASGKDTIYKRLLDDPELQLHRVVPYTTRPPRSGERSGEEYIFCSQAQAEEMQKKGKVLEMRTYSTIYGPWSYFTADDGQIDLEIHDYLLIGTPEAFLGLRNYFGAEKTVPLYIYLDDGCRLQRALDRERREEHPGYAELCRRFLADEEDFSEKNLQVCGITDALRFENVNLDEVCMQIGSVIQKCRERNRNSKR